MFKPNRKFQAGLDQAKQRREREKNSLSLRRKEREKKLANKRKKILNTNTGIRTSDGQYINHEFNEIEKKQMLLKLPRFAQGCMSNHDVTILECTQKIRQLLSVASNAPIQEVVNCGVIPRLIQFLTFDQREELKFESLWCLTNIISSENKEFTSTIVRNGAIPLFIKMLSSSNYALQEQAVWALGNMAGDCVEIKNLLIKHHVLPAILNVCKLKFDPNYKCRAYNGTKHETSMQQFMSLFKNVAWALSNFCRHPKQSQSPIPESTKLLLQCLWHLLQQEMIIQSEGAEYTQSIGWCFSYLLHDIDDADNDIEIIEIMNHTGITKGLIHLLKVPDHSPRHSVLRSCGQMLTVHDKYTSVMIENGILPHLYNLLKLYCTQSKNNSTQVKEMCWMISNISAGTARQVKSVAKANIFPLLIEILKTSRNFVANEALWAISNATSSNDKAIISYLVQQNVIQALCSFFKRRFRMDTFDKIKDNKLLLCCLECVENILATDDKNGSIATEFETYGGCDFVEDVQGIEQISQEIYDKAMKIVQSLNKKFVMQQRGMNHNTTGADNNVNSQFTFGLNNDNKENDNRTFFNF